jgi:hypothetical protein
VVRGEEPELPLPRQKLNISTADLMSEEDFNLSSDGEFDPYSIFKA